MEWLLVHSHTRHRRGRWLSLIRTSIIGYYSKDCHRAHWELHKKSCGVVAVPTRWKLVVMNAPVDDEIAAISKWLAYWRSALSKCYMSPTDLAHSLQDIMC